MSVAALLGGSLLARSSLCVVHPLAYSSQGPGWCVVAYANIRTTRLKLCTNAVRLNPETILISGMLSLRKHPPALGRAPFGTK